MCEKDVKATQGNDVNTGVCVAMQDIPSREETLGDIVIALLRDGQIISRRTICLKLVARIEAETHPIMQAHLSDLMRIILRNDQF
ncbi:hypothetical protein [Pseudescherichia vulneris]|uniref:hypothetical protein n=1 Tax=Pseudescherichia vulneris TaxID=566 RepID=UPI0012AC1110|nr:hypothetical protein [Pseudescherichia vulneris]